MSPSDLTPVVATREPLLAVEEPFVRLGLPPEGTQWWGWLCQLRVYPPAVWVAPREDTPPPPAELLAQLPEVEGATTRTIELPGLGRVVLRGRPRGEGELWVCHVAHQIDGELLLAICRGQVGRPVAWSALTPDQLTPIQCDRVRAVLLGLSAIVARRHPTWWGEPCPLLYSWWRSWVWQDGTPVMHAGIGLDLRDRESWA